jgi:cytosine/adenosine deaminase-related metal-dependent hydrolase
MRLAALIQKPIHGPEAMDAKTVFKLATIEGAKALHLENEVGSIEIGKKADLVLIDLNSYVNSVLDNDEQVYSNLVYSSGTNNVSSVMINGKWVVTNGESLIYDKNKLREESIMELKELLKRM